MLSERALSMANGQFGLPGSESGQFGRAKM